MSIFERGESRGRGLVRARDQLQDAEAMLPPAGSEARWREEVMPGGTSGEVMLTLSRQEGEEITEVGDCRLGVGKSKRSVASCC